MVLSKINQQVNYIEKRTIDPEDKGHESCFYALDILDVPILIVLGKQKYTFSSQNVIYYPIYVVDEKETIRAQIGVFESSLKNVINLVDREGDIDLEKMGEPLIYQFVTREFLLKTKTNPNKYLKNHGVEERDVEIRVNSRDDPWSRTSLDEGDRKEEPLADKDLSDKDLSDKDLSDKDLSDKDLSEDSSDDEMDVLSIKVAKNKVSEEKQKTDRVLEKGIFSVEENFRLPKTLEEETKHDSDKIKIDYKESSTNNWIQKFLRNNAYDILENEGQGDCFFATLRDAFQQIGQKTTVEKMRNLLASQLTDLVYEEHRHLYDDFETQKKDIEKSLKEMKNTNQILKSRFKKMMDNPQEIEKNIEEIKKKYKHQMEEYKNTKHLQEEYVGYMKNIHSLEEFRHYITTSQFWADAWAISTLEHLLKIKVIILSEESYKEKEFDNVLNCGEVNKHQSSASFEPQHYVIVAYNGTHYRLVSYHKKGIFSFQELPYDIKIMVVNKCLEKNAGVFYLIQDFRNFKTLLGIDPDEGSPSDEDEEEATENDHLYNKSTVFVFNSKSLDAKPGKGSNETIPKERVGEFVTLSKFKNWRRKLDDAWSESPFRVDKMRWTSVEHYLQGAKFKKGFPDFYSQFSLDHPSELSRDVELAKKAGDITKTKHKDLRPQGVKIDPDYVLGRAAVEREEALKAKFSDNEDLKQLLLSTHNALLKKSARRKPAEADILLMKVRGNVINDN